MKTKLKLDTSQLKNFFILHGEKVAFGVVIALAVWMGLGALKTPLYPRKPEDLQRDVSNLRTTIENENWSLDRPDIPPIPNPPYADQIKDGMVPVEPSKFAFGLPFNNPIRENKVRREQPTFYPPLEVLAKFNRGAVELKGQVQGDANGSVQGQQWAVVTALVPVGEQTVEYERLFENALHVNPELDTPHYVNFAIERRVAPDGPWEPVALGTQLTEALDKFALGEQVVDPKLKEMAVCQPSFALASGSHKGTLGHPPEIAEMAVAIEAAPAAPVEPVAAAPAAQAGGMLNPLLPQKNVASGVNDNPVVNQAKNDTAEPIVVPPYRLLRFFDRSVQSNASYQYRVQLVLANPNYDVPRRFLKDPALATDETRRTPWSDPSAPVVIRGDYSMLAGKTDSRRSINEAKGTVGIVKWDLNLGVEVLHNFDGLMRGWYLNFPATPATVMAPGQGGVTTSSVDFLPEAMLLDFAGNDPLQQPGGNRFYRAPAEMLFMRANGQLEIGQQMIDTTTVERIEAQLQAAPAAAVPGAAQAPGQAPAAAPGGIFGLGNP